MRKAFLGWLTAAMLATGASAHEFWIEPEAYRVAPGDAIVASLRVGEDFAGAEVPYLSFTSFTVTDPEGTRMIRGTLGDVPAARVETGAPGTAILAYFSTASSLTFDAFEEFESYLVFENNAWAVERHRALGFPETGIREQYIRNAKALVAVGDEDVRDRAIGLPFEVVARDTPREAAAGGGMEIELLWRGRPVVEQGFNVFIKGGDDNPITLTTDADGRATIPMDGAGRYMVNAVHLAPIDTGGVHWQSHWASLTFEIE